MDPLGRDPLIRSSERHLYAKNRLSRTVRDGVVFKSWDRARAATSDTAPHAGVDAGGAAAGSCQSVAEFVDLLGRSVQEPPVWGAGLLPPGELSVAEPSRSVPVVQPRSAAWLGQQLRA